VAERLLDDDNGDVLADMDGWRKNNGLVGKYGLEREASERPIVMRLTRLTTLVNRLLRSMSKGPYMLLPTSM